MIQSSAHVRFISKHKEPLYGYRCRLNIDRDTYLRFSLWVFHLSHVLCNFLDLILIF